MYTLYVFAPAPPGQEPPVDRVDPAEVPGAAVAASIVFGEQPVYGRGADQVHLTADGEVVIQRDAGAIFSSRP